MKFGEKVGFRLSRKQQRLQDTGETRDKIPFPEEHVDEDAPRALRRTRDRDGLTYRMVDRYRDEYDFPEEVEWLRDRRVRFAKITSVEYRENKVYDLTVPSTESFWANGFINHNSTNFGILYGGGAKRIGEIMGEGEAKGKEIKNKVLGGLSTLQNWMSDLVDEAYQNEEIETHMGRKIRFYNGGEYRAVNCKVQGTATGDLTRLAMVLVYEALRKTGDLEDCLMFASMHDEIVFEIRKDRLDDLIPVIRERMTYPGSESLWDFDVPLQVDVEVGETWDCFVDWDAIHHIDDETGRAKEPVPRFLADHIEMEPGMYVEGEEPVEDRPEDEESSEATEAEDDTEDRTIVKTGEDLDEAVDGKQESLDTSPEVPDFPVYEFQTDWIVQQKTAQRYMLQLKRIVSFFRNWYRGGDRLLRVVDHNGKTMLDPEESPVVVDPAIFEALADYEGI